MRVDFRFRCSAMIVGYQPYSISSGMLVHRRRGQASKSSNIQHTGEGKKNFRKLSCVVHSLFSFLDRAASMIVCGRSCIALDLTIYTLHHATLDRATALTFHEFPVLCHEWMPIKVCVKCIHSRSRNFPVVHSFPWVTTKNAGVLTACRPLAVLQQRSAAASSHAQ